MKLAATLLSCSVVFAKVPHKVDDLAEMDEDERKEFDEDIFSFDEDGVSLTLQQVLEFCRMNGMLGKSSTKIK